MLTCLLECLIIYDSANINSTIPGQLLMNSKERFLNALNLKEVDRTPVASVVTGITVSMMEECGLDWTEVHTDPQKLARLSETIWTKHQIECIKVPFDMAVESEILGSAIE